MRTSCVAPTASAAMAPPAEQTPKHVFKALRDRRLRSSEQGDVLRRYLRWPLAQRERADQRVRKRAQRQLLDAGGRGPRYGRAHLDAGERRATAPGIAGVRARRHPAARAGWFPHTSCSEIARSQGDFRLDAEQLDPHHGRRCLDADLLFLRGGNLPFPRKLRETLASFSSFWNVIRLPVTRSVGLKGQGGPGVSETRGGARGVIDRRHEAPPRVTGKAVGNPKVASSRRACA